MNPYSKTIIDEVSGVEVSNDHYLDYQAGIKEVVEWIKLHYSPEFSMTDMEAKLKEWGCQE